MIIYGFWFYHELAEKVGTRPGKHHGDEGDREDSYINLTVPDGTTYRTKTSSFRLELFRQNPKCVACERIGTLWLLEAHRKNEPPHLNLYHVGEEIAEWKNLSKDGLVMMTKDHIVPRSRGGATKLENLQTMCSICNGKKGNKMNQEFHRDPLRAPQPKLFKGEMLNLGGMIHLL